jgi:hypothetical protein
MHTQMVLTLASILFSRLYNFEYSLRECSLWSGDWSRWHYVSAGYLDGATVGKAACQCQSVAYILLPCDHLVQCLLLLVFNHEVPI